MKPDPLQVLAKHAPDASSYRKVHEHSARVWCLARDMTRHMETFDFSLLQRACLLHDVGRLLHPPKTSLAIRHGIAGAEILRGEGLHEEARVAERHIGTGITAEDVLAQHLPIPVTDWVPRTAVELVVAHADNLDGKGIRDERDVEERFARELGEQARRKARAFHLRVRRLLDQGRV